MNNDLNICIIGSGLTAVAAADVLISRGYKPVILDYGNVLDNDRLSIVKRMSSFQSLP